MRHILVYGLLASWLSMTMAQADVDGTTPTKIEWDDLVDKTWQPQALLDKFIEQHQPSREEIYAEIERLNAAAPIEASLNGKVVKMPGYVLPLEYDGTAVREFLLVPYIGACIHVPPPPPNQVVYAKMGEHKPLKANGMFAPVWVTGKLHTQSTISDMAESSYTMDVYEVIPYKL